MDLIEYGIRRPQLTVLGFIMAVVLGISALRTIPLAEDPAFPIPTFPIVAVLPGASPTDMEQLIVDPIEETLNGLEGLKRVKTDIRDGVASMIVEFDPGVDVDAKYDEVIREVGALRPTLPADLTRLDIDRFNSSNVAVVQLALVSDALPYREIERMARLLEDRLEQVPGVKGADRWAVPAREVVVDLQLDRLEANHLSPAQVLGAIRSESLSLPGGAVNAGSRKFNVKTSGSYRTIEEVRSTVVGGAAGALVHLGDVARVEWSHEDLRHIGRYNGKRAAFVTAKMKDGQRIGVVRDAIYAELARFDRALPPGMVLERGFDQSKNVATRLSRLTEDLIIAILLVLVTLLPLGLRASAVVMTSIPLSLAIGVFLLKATGFSINQLSIVGFVIALGLLVDDSIVVVENIARMLRMGLPRREAAIRATRQIAVAVLGCTAALIAAFLPLLFLPGNPGQFIRSLPVAVVFTIIASLIISLTIVPFLASVILKPEHDERGNRFMRALNWAIDRTYASWLHQALARPRLVLAGAGVLIAGSVALVPTIGFSLFPKADTPQFLVTIDAGDGSSLGETDRIARTVEIELHRLPGVRSVFMNVGRGNPSVYYNVTQRPEQAGIAEALVVLEKFEARTTPALRDSLQARLDRIPNARILVKAFENGPPLDAPVALRLVGPDLDTLRTIAAKTQELFDRTPGLTVVHNPFERKATDLRVLIDRNKAGLLGIPTADIDRTIRIGLAGIEAGSVRETDGNDYGIRVRLRDGNEAAGLDGAPAVELLDRLKLLSASGRVVPLSQLARTRFEASVPVIQHYNRERTVTVTANVRNGFNTDRITQDILGQVGGWTLPAGYRIIPAGEIESRQESFGGLGTAIIFAVFLTIGILVLEFGSFRSTLIVASVIPLGIVGGLIALFVAGNSLSFTAMVGFVALVGIEIKNSILLVDFTNQLRGEGVPLTEAIEQAGRIRFVPIVLTTLTAVGGLLPLAVQGSSLYSPLAQVIIGGLISSTLLARLVTPVVYQLLAPPIGEPEPSSERAPSGGSTVRPDYA